MCEWKPGDVATIYCPDTRRTGLRSSNDGWWTRDGFFIDAAVHDARPLVVIDPEDREQVERLVRLWTQSEVGKAMSFADGLQDALRNLLEPPAPDEPTDPKARVTDRRENIWRLLADGDWVCTSGPDIGEYLLWWQLAERGPLSIEGVS